MVMDDESDSEEEEEEELDLDDQRMAKLLRAVNEDKAKVKINVPNYGGNLND